MQTLEEGYYMFRATALNPQGDVQSLYSSNYFIWDAASHKAARQNYIQVLADNGFSNIKITHTALSAVNDS
jgi:hypothetical protein